MKLNPNLLRKVKIEWEVKIYHEILSNDNFKEINKFLDKLKEEFEIIENTTDNMDLIKNACKLISKEIKI